MLRSILIYIVKLLLHIDELILAIEAHLTQETRLTMSQNQRQQPTKAKRTVIPLHILGLEDGPFSGVVSSSNGSQTLCSAAQNI